MSLPGAFCYRAAAELVRAFREVVLIRSIVDPKPLALAVLGAVAMAAAFGCARRPGEPEGLPVAVNAEDIAMGRCVQTCTPDYGPRPITDEECARVEDGLEFFPVDVWNWEGEEAAYAYQDGTTEFLSTMTPTCSVEKHAEMVDTNANCQSEYNPTPAPIDRCGSTRALHVRGGPFREWGGGIGKRLDGLADAAAGMSCPKPPQANPDPSLPAVCPELDPLVADAPGVIIEPETDEQEEMRYAFPTNSYYEMMVDLREWEGIAFWARRGPDSQPGFRVALGDKNLDDDASMLATAGGIPNPRCRRAKECDCRNHRPCTQLPNSTEFACWDPKLEESPQADAWNHELYRCGYSQCNDPYDAYEDVPDWPFLTPETPNKTYQYAATASCNRYVFKNDITHDQCFDPSGEPPPESSERCGDPWISPVRLSTDWQFFRVPFSELRQEGYGKEFPAIDLSAVTMVRFTWQQGWVDFWLDDVRFFRRRR